MSEHGELERRQARRGLILQVEGCASYSRLARAVGTNEGVTLAAWITSLSRSSRTRQPLLVLAYSGPCVLRRRLRHVDNFVAGPEAIRTGARAGTVWTCKRFLALLPQVNGRIGSRSRVAGRTVPTICKPLRPDEHRFDQPGGTLSGGERKVLAIGAQYWEIQNCCCCTNRPREFGSA